MRYTFVSLTLLSAVLTGCGGGNSNSTNATDVSAPPPLSVSDAPAPGRAAETRTVLGETGPECLRSSWAAGTAELCDGSVIYYDYVYDDYGADGGLLSPDPALLNLLTRGASAGSPVANVPGLLAPAAGDQSYPEGLENTADLVRLALFIDGNDLVIEAELNTMFRVDDAIVGVAIDTDNDAQTGGGHWHPLNISSEGWDQLIIIDQGDPDTNLMRARVALPEGDTWRVQAAVAQRDGTVMNVAFRGTNETARADGGVNQVLPDAGNYWEDRQAAVLATGDISEFGHRVDVSDLHNRVTAPAPLPSGFHQRVYTSEFSIGEGVSLAGLPGRDGGGLFCGQRFNYLGKYQPYGVYVPEDLANGERPAGLQLVLHGCEANHASQINQANMQQQFGDQLDRILVAPLGRGTVGFYTGISERDVLDVMADIENTYTIDEDRRVVSGYSMGGFGALHMASHYPHKFAGLVNWVGFTGNLFNVPSLIEPVDMLLETVTDLLLGNLLTPIVGSIAEEGTGTENVIDYLGNLRHIPSAHLYAAADELVQVNQAIALSQRLAATDGLAYNFFLHPVAEHLTFLLLDDWRKEAAISQDWVRVTNPARVTYLFNPVFDYPEFDIRHDRAYWLSELRSRDGGESLVDLNAPGCGDEALTIEANRGFGGAPVPWIGSARDIVMRDTLPAGRIITGTLTNVSAATIDMAAVCLDDRPAVFNIESDGPALLTLSDGREITLQKGVNQGAL